MPSAVRFLITLALVASAGALRADPVTYPPSWASLDQRPIPDWYQDAKFGIFIHWGVYSVPAWGVRGEYAEWYWNKMHDQKPDNPWWRFHQANYGADFPYAQFAPMFRAELFDARQWADLFVRSGARYIVPTSKHHEGFALWPSAEASRDWGRPWNSVEVGPHRDLLGELATAVRARGLRFGVYYSLYEWYNPLWLSDRPKFVATHLFPQFKDLVTRYQPSLIFSDGEWEMTSAEWRSEELLAWLYNQSPVKADVVVDDRWGKDTRHKHGGYYTTEYAAGMEGAAHAWEESEGIGFSYGYNRAESLDDYKTSRHLILLLIDTVSRGGNLLLDIGPAADGTIPVIMQQRLVDRGDWLKVNGEAIYRTRYAGRSCQWSDGPRPKQEFGEYKVKYDLLDLVGQAPVGGHAVKQVYFTQGQDALYAIVVGWPMGEVAMHDVQVPANAEISMLGCPDPITFRIQDTTLRVKMPDRGPEGMPVRYAYTFRIPGARVLPERSPAAAGPAPISTP